MFDWYPQYEYYLACVQLIFFMLGMGAMLRVSDFVQVLKQPRSLLYALAFQLLLVPLLAVVINYVGQFEAGVAIGLVLVALMPGGSVSKIFTHLGRGNVALSITLSALSTLAAVLTVPLFLRVLVFGFIPDDFAMPVKRMFVEVALFLLLPVVVGMVLARLAPNGRKLLSRGCVRIGWLIVIAMIAGSLGSGRIQPGDYGWRAPLAIIAFCMISQQASMLPFYIFHWQRADRLAIGIEVTMRNMNLALLMKALLFPEDSGVDPIAHGVLFVILFYAAVALCAGFPLALNHLRLSRRERRDANVLLSTDCCHVPASTPRPYESARPPADGC
jgi:BASS family bile acid:Na+ symporter